MENLERKDRIKVLLNTILELKLLDPSVETKLTIQKLQQELNELTIGHSTKQ